MGAPELACAACGYDVAGLPDTDRAVRCPECGYVGPPVAPTARNALRPWFLASTICAAVGNVLVLIGSLLLGLICFAADWAFDDAIRAAIPRFILTAFCAITLIALCLPKRPGANGLRVGVAVGHVLLFVVACILWFGGAAGQYWGAPLWVAVLLGGQAITSIASLLIGTGLPAKFGSLRGNVA